MRHAIGIDLGGSSAKLALVSEQGHARWPQTIPLSSSGDPLTILAPVERAVRHLQERAMHAGLSVAALGCSVTAYFDPTRTYLDLCNIRALDGFAFTRWLQDTFSLPTAVDNDACMAAIGEMRLAGAGSARRVLFVVIGSGIGVVLLVDGVVVRNMHGVTGDAGHLLVNPSSQERCLSGCRGCLETVVAAPALARAGRRAATDGRSPALAAVLAAQGDVTGADVAAAAAQGDSAAQAIIGEAARWLGLGLASWAAIYEPEVILLGGGVSGLGEPWLQVATATLHEVGMPILVAKTDVRLATLGNQAGVLGAGLAALQDIGT